MYANDCYISYDQSLTRVILRRIMSTKATWRILLPAHKGIAWYRKQRCANIWVCSCEKVSQNIASLRPFFLKIPHICLTPIYVLESAVGAQLRIISTRVDPRQPTGMPKSSRKWVFFLVKKIKKQAPQVSRMAQSLSRSLSQSLSDKVTYWAVSGQLKGKKWPTCFLWILRMRVFFLFQK